MFIAILLIVGVGCAIGIASVWLDDVGHSVEGRSVRNASPSGQNGVFRFSGLIFLGCVVAGFFDSTLFVWALGLLPFSAALDLYCANGLARKNSSQNLD